MTTLLEVRDLCAYYGATQALFGLSFAIAQGGITALLGANGAGKTTTLRALSGMVRTSGHVVLDGRPIRGLATEDIARLGIAHVPGGRGTFTRLTVEENLALGAMSRHDRAAIGADLDRVYGYFPVLAERRSQQAGTLSGGEQQMLAIARCLMGQPRLIMLDEPSLGLAPVVVEDVFRVVRELNERDGLTIVLVEQNVAQSLTLAHRGYVLENGRIVMTGGGAELLADDRVRKAYVGL